LSRAQPALLGFLYDPFTVAVYSSSISTSEDARRRGIMELLVFTLLLVVLAILAARFGSDSTRRIPDGYHR
jgi:hypothetical protein